MSDGSFEFTPLGDRVLLRKRVHGEEQQDGTVKLASGLVARAVDMEQRPECEVVKIGYGCSDKFKEVIQEGDLVLIGMHVGIQYQEHTIVYEKEILGKLSLHVSVVEK